MSTFHTCRSVRATLPYRLSSGRMLPLACVLASLTLAVPISAPANDQQQRDEAAMFKQADRDGDGRLNRDEYAQMLSGQGADASAAGEGSGEGLPATPHQATVLAPFEDRDRNGDGYIGADEIGMHSETSN